MSRPTQLNVVLLEGNLTADPEIRSTANGNRVVNLRVANTIVIPRGDRVDQEISTFLSAEGWNEIADAVDGLTKGTFVRIEGQLRVSSWEQDGQKRSRVYVGIRSIWTPGIGYRAPVQQAGGQRYQGQQSPQGNGSWGGHGGHGGQSGQPPAAPLRPGGFAYPPQPAADAPVDGPLPF